MLRILPLLLLSLISQAQTPNRFALDSLANKARFYLNTKQPDSLYALMGKAFQQEISANQFRSITTGLSAQLGTWQQNTFRAYKGPAIRYKATFANALMDFYLSQDSTGHIQTFLFRNYEPDPPVTFPAVANSNPLRTQLDRRLGTILEMKTGQSYEALLKDRITKPLGMAHTTLTLSDSKKAQFVQGHDSERNPASSWEFQSLAGAGAIRSTVNDLMLYLKAQMGKAPKSLTKAMQRTQQPTFSEKERQIGLGWFIDNEGWYYHNGGTGGFTSFAGFSPQRQMAIVVLSNASARVDSFCQQLIELFENK